MVQHNYDGGLTDYGYMLSCAYPTALSYPPNEPYFVEFDANIQHQPNFHMFNHGLLIVEVSTMIVTLFVVVIQLHIINSG